MLPADLMDKHNGAPWCDTCEEGACLTESFGWRHTSNDFPFGIPEHLDPNSGHKVTTRAWNMTPLFRER
jgi:hypothetical protein